MSGIMSGEGGCDREGRKLELVYIEECGDDGLEGGMEVRGVGGNEGI